MEAATSLEGEYFKGEHKLPSIKGKERNLLTTPMHTLEVFILRVLRIPGGLHAFRRTPR